MLGLYTLSELVFWWPKRFGNHVLHHRSGVGFGEDVSENFCNLPQQVIWHSHPLHARVNSQAEVGKNPWHLPGETTPTLSRGGLPKNVRCLFVTFTHVARFWQNSHFNCAWTLPTEPQSKRCNNKSKKTDKKSKRGWKCCINLQSQDHILSFCWHSKMNPAQNTYY